MPRPTLVADREPLFRTDAVRIAVLMIMVGLGGCGQRGDATRQGKLFFKQHEPALAAVVTAIAQCKGPGTRAIFASGESSYVPSVPSAPVCPDLHLIAAALTKAGVRSAYIIGDAPYGTADHSGAILMLPNPHDYEDNYSSSLDYYSTPQNTARGRSVALTAEPAQWFFRYIPATPVNGS